MEKILTESSPPELNLITVFCKPKFIHSFFSSCGCFCAKYGNPPDFCGFLQVSPVEKPVENVDNPCEKLCGLENNILFMSTDFLLFFVR